MKLQTRTTHGLILGAILGLIALGNPHFQISDLLLIEPTRDLMQRRIEPFDFFVTVGLTACLIGLAIRFLKRTFFK